MKTEVNSFFSQGGQAVLDKKKEFYQRLLKGVKETLVQSSVSLLPYHRRNV